MSEKKPQVSPKDYKFDGDADSVPYSILVRFAFEELGKELTGILLNPIYTNKKTATLVDPIKRIAEDEKIENAEDYLKLTKHIPYLR